MLCTSKFKSLPKKPKRILFTSESAGVSRVYHKRSWCCQLVNLYKGLKFLFFSSTNNDPEFSSSFVARSTLINAWFHHGLFSSVDFISLSLFLALHSSLINPDPADPSISSEAGKSLCARRENGLLARGTRARRRGSATSLVSALSFVNARRLLTYFHFAAPPPFATVTFIITRDQLLIAHLRLPEMLSDLLNPSLVTRVYNTHVI